MQIRDSTPKTGLVIDDLIHDITVEKNITTIINTHDMNSVMEIGVNIALLHDGKLAWSGNKEESAYFQKRSPAEFCVCFSFPAESEGPACGVKSEK